jgi:hypothetical protein
VALKDAFRVLNAMEADGVIGRFAVAGAVGAYTYIEAASTHDLDVLLLLGNKSSRHSISLASIFTYLKKRGYTDHQGEGIVIEGWPVQFLPAADVLDEEALEEAQSKEIRSDNETIPVRVLRAEHLVAIATRVGRPKDISRIAEFVAQKKVNMPRLREVLDRHGLRRKWSDVARRIGIADFPA